MTRWQIWALSTSSSPCIRCPGPKSRTPPPWSALLLNPLEGITFPVELADTPGYVEALLEAQVPLFVHTVNDPADQAALVRQGISGIYTDLGAPAPQE